jgi:hypothetical protein
MENWTARYRAALSAELALTEKKYNSPTARSRAAILLCKKALVKLRNHLAVQTFNGQGEEIAFFKTVKPFFYSKYIYYVSIYSFQVHQPAGSREVLQDYIRAQLAGLDLFFEQNRSFYTYYRAGLTQLDAAYFTRGAFEVHPEPDDFEADPQFSTSHDYKLAKLLANEDYRAFLNAELARLNAEPGAVVLPVKPANWTAGKTDAIELIYALKATGAINNGNIDISELVHIFEFVFTIDLKEFYHKFTDITNRKKDIPVFLNKLTAGLLRWIDDKLAL